MGIQIKKQIAILGATSHIAKGLIFNFLKSNEYSLSLFARNTDDVNRFLASLNYDFDKVYHIDTFPNGKYDIIINCIGVGTPKNANIVGRQILFITEFFDNLIINYLKLNPDTLYINFSSGAAYGTNFFQPVALGYKNSIDINNIRSTDYYGIAKLHSETKHRAFNELNIVDLRVFSYFSHFIDLSAGYLITDMINSILLKKTFVTDNSEIVRDYVVPSDLYTLVLCCITASKLNNAFDVYSKAPISKMDIIKLFETYFNLKISITDQFIYSNASGDKNNYYSNNYFASSIGYNPKYSSKEGLCFETKLLISAKAT
jgi:nucleoside-diphosphate-sugar epimerase